MLMRSVPYRLFFAAIAICGVVFITNQAPAQSPKIAATPPMGWNSWNHFNRKIDDATVRAQADAMVSSGMRDAGYVYINIDDTWEGTRDAQGVIQTNEKFPNMKALADYVHSKGLKLGIYSSPGAKTCAGFEGSLNHEEQDAQSYAAWGIDYLKYDLCGFRDVMKTAPDHTAAHQMMLDAYTKMHSALLKTGRPIVYSLCQYGEDAVWRWGPQVGGNAWRTTGDISDRYASMSNIGFGQAGLSKYAAPGHWNDPDMLEVGNGGMNADEYKTHMSLWAILAAPLLAGNDLSTMTPETIALLTNKEVIAIDQDPLGKQGDRAWVEGPLEIWVRRLKDGSSAVGMFNRNSSPMEMKFNLALLGYKGAAHLHDLWAARDLPTPEATRVAGTDFPVTEFAYVTTVPGHGVVFLRVSK
jgi:alpha-galactosidase